MLNTGKVKSCKSHTHCVCETAANVQTKKESPDVRYWESDMEERIVYAMRLAKSREIVHPGQSVVVLTGWKEKINMTNTLRVIVMPSDGKPITNLYLPKLDIFK